MKTREFISGLEHDKIVEAIGEAEKQTSGEIRLFITRREPADVMAAAQKSFTHMGMHRTNEKNGVLIFVAPRLRKFAVIGDSGVHARCGDEFWQEVTEEISTHFRSGGFTDGILHGIARAGKLLAEHFPRHPGDKNQLSDDIAHD